MKNIGLNLLTFLIFCLTFLPNITDGQSVTATNKANFSSITVTNCGGNIWKVAAYQSNQWSAGELTIRFNGTIIGSCCVNCGCWNTALKYTTNQGWSATNDGSFSMTGHTGRWVYIEVNTTAKTANTRADWTCSACTQPTAPTSISGTTTICSGGTTTLTTSGGSDGSGATFQWGTGATVGSNIISGATSSSYTTPTLTTNTTYWVRRVGTAAGCTNTTTGVTTTVTVNPTSVGGTISGGSTPICQGTGTGTMTLSGHTGSIIKWQKRVNSGAWSDISNTSTTYSEIPSSSGTWEYRAEVKSGVCSSVFSGTRSIVVNSVPTQPSIISGSGTPCQGSSQIYSVTNVSGVTYNWALPSGWTQTAGGTTNSITVTVGSTSGNVTVTPSNGCGSGTNRSLSITVSPTTVSGSISGGATVCSGSNTGSLTLSGHTGNVIRWESSTNGTTWSNITNTTTSQSYTNLTTTTQYRAVVQSGVCSQLTTSSATITVSPTTVAGSISGGSTVCSSSNSGSLTLSGHTGSVLRWESSTDGTTWNSITNTTTTQNYTNLTTTTQYRAVVQSGVCSQLTTSSTTITVSPTTVSGSISGSTTVCSGSNSGSLTLSGHTGSVLRWESSTDGTTWNSITNTTTIQNYTNLTTTTQYRAVVQSGSCSSTTTSAVSITVSPTTVSGSISGSTTVCSGSNTGSLTLSGHTGNVIRWESSTDGTTWSSITNTTTSQSYSNLTTTTQYRAVVQSGSCSSATTSAVSITVSPITVTGSISGGATVCSGSNSGTLTLSGHTGDVLKWETSTNNGSTWSDVSNTTTSQTYTNLTTTTQYRAVVQSGSCTSATTSAVTITVYDVLLSGSISGNQTMCSGVVPDSIVNTVLPSGGNGVYSYQWQSSSNNSTWVNISGQTSKDYYTGALGSSTYYRRAVNSGDCPTAYTASSFIKINTCNGPGGVTNDIIFWLKSDEGVIGSNPITMWQDQSGNEKHAVKSLGNPLKTSTVTNYHPTILFDGNSGFDTDSIIIEQIFIVFKPDTSLSNSSNFQILGRKNHGNINNARVLGFGNKNIISSNDSHSFASEDRIRINGKFNTSLSNTGFNLISIDSENKGKVKDVYKLGQKSVGTSYDNLKGEISEIICYSSKKTGADLNKIETYLSVKYGITLSNNNGGTNGNYYNSNGDLIWDASDNNSYHYDVVGIGKDNVNRLNQKQTKTKDNKLVVFVDNLSSSNEGNTGTITNNRSFVMIGHNNASLKSTVASDLEKPSEIKKRLDREWKITNTNFDDNFNLEIEWDSSGTFDLSDVRLLVDDDGDFTNADVYGPADGLTFRLGSIIVEDVNSSFIPKGSTKYITIGSVDSLTVLPVDLLYFKGEQNGTNVDLKWETGSEINSDYFEVLHSTNGFDFKKIGRLNAAGNSTRCKKYELIHYNAEQGVNYYKLKQYDFGGRYEEYEKIMVLFDYVVDNYEFLVYPNPNNDNGVVYLKSDYTGEVNIHIFDMKGRVVRKELINIKQNNVETIKDLNLPTGIYPFVISSPNNSFLSKTFKLIIN